MSRGLKFCIRKKGDCTINVGKTKALTCAFVKTRFSHNVAEMMNMKSYVSLSKIFKQQNLDFAKRKTPKDLRGGSCQFCKGRQLNNFHLPNVFHWLSNDYI